MSYSQPSEVRLPDGDPLTLGGIHSPAIVAKLIEGEIIPRLLMAHRNETESDGRLCQPCAQNNVTAEEADAFAQLALDSDAHQLTGYVDTFLARGIEVETVLVELLAPAARVLGTQWEDDRIDFIAVTMGLWRLQEVVHELAARSPGAIRNAGGDRRALFCVMPGDSHSLGATIVDECFRRRGWNTLCLPSTSEAELLALVRERWFEIIGLTISCDQHIGDLARLIAALRAASRNPLAGVMVGGPLFIQNPDIARQVGADATAKDAHLAVDRAEKLVSKAALGDAITA
jgi:MerR family transcriptional regulator, light-induced transcriptional regulator